MWVDCLRSTLRCLPSGFVIRIHLFCAIIVFTKLAKHAELEKTGASLFKRALTLFHWVVASRAFVFKSILQIVDPH